MTHTMGMNGACPACLGHAEVDRTSATMLLCLLVSPFNYGFAILKPAVFFPGLFLAAVLKSNFGTGQISQH